MPVGTDWDQVPGLQASELVISMKTAWARCPNGDVARRYGITDKNPAGDYWKKIPGNVSCLAGESISLPPPISILFGGIIAGIIFIQDQKGEIYSLFLSI
uniref:Uncharacterized protein n=1 Tax=Laticauda laticaudata TaxID=8630 RepID=A0A8C5RSX7_LATLA